jgi:hypothetical protein
MLAVDPKTLFSFVNFLAVERIGYHVDAYLYGCVNAVVGICNYCAIQAEKRLITKTKDFLFNFNCLAAFLTSEKQPNPAEILVGTVEYALSSGFLGELIEFVNNYRQYIVGRIEEALDSKTTDECFEILYDVISYSLSAKIILATLLSFPDQLGDKLRFVTNTYNIVDETNNRLKVAVQTQVMDFDGHLWCNYKKIIAKDKREKGIAVANKWVDYYVERNMFYPRPFKSKLLA